MLRMTLVGIPASVVHVKSVCSPRVESDGTSLGGNLKNRTSMKNIFDVSENKTILNFLRNVHLLEKILNNKRYDINRLGVALLAVFR